MLFPVVLDDFRVPVRPWDLWLANKVAISQEVMNKETEPRTQDMTIEEHIVYYAKKNWVNPNLAIKIARCESWLNPNAKNKNSSASGLFQHLRRYRDGRAKKYGRPWASIWDGEAQAEVSIKMLKYEGTRPRLPSYGCRWKVK